MTDNSDNSIEVFPGKAYDREDGETIQVMYKSTKGQRLIAPVVMLHQMIKLDQDQGIDMASGFPIYTNPQLRGIQDLINAKARTWLRECIMADGEVVWTCYPPTPEAFVKKLSYTRAVANSAKNKTAFTKALTTYLADIADNAGKNQNAVWAMYGRPMLHEAELGMQPAQGIAILAKVLTGFKEHTTDSAALVYAAFVEEQLEQAAFQSDGLF